jgi:hypothetical protein
LITERKREKTKKRLAIKNGGEFPNRLSDFEQSHITADRKEKRRGEKKQRRLRIKNGRRIFPQD